MRLVSYNILDGGEGRADPLAETLLAQRPDIVVLVEADDQAVLNRIASRLGMDFIRGEGKKGAAAILSRWPIRDSINHAPLRPHITKTLLEATIEQPGGPAWSVAALHLHAQASEAAETIRMGELEDVLDVFAQHRDSGRAHILAGDFNSNSPLQEIDPQRCKPGTRQQWQENGGQIPRRVIQKLMDQGYIDTLAARDPSAARTQGSFTTQFPGQRVDYIFTYGLPTQAIGAAWIEQDRLAQFASDHFPVGAEILQD
jgi:endonuclease/exonuclease/phosphatase family metal-dependent hydrolase